MSNTKHTPTPWARSKTFGQLNVQDDKYMLSDADAAFIVRAVNSHEHLVAALKVFSAFADVLAEQVPDDIALAIFAGGAMHFGPSGGVTVGDLRKARAALAATEA